MMSVRILLFDRADCPERDWLDDFYKITLEKVRKISDDVWFVSKNHREGSQNIFFDSSNDLMRYISDAPSDTDFVLLNAYAALLDVDAVFDMLREHRSLAFDYSYPENIPSGLLPEIINSEVAPFILRTLPENTPMYNINIRELFQSDLSSYDSNIYISPVKLAQYRTDFIPDSLSHAKIMRRIIEKKGADLKMAELEQAVQDDPLLIRGRPSYYEIQLTTERESGELFAGNLIKNEGFFDIDDLKKSLDTIAEFSYNPSVLFGLYGEPFLHPEITKIIDMLSAYPSVDFYFESRGLIADFDIVKKSLLLPNVRVIFDLSFVNEDSFARYKKPVNSMLTLPTLQTLEEEIKKLVPRDRVYVQWTRTAINEDELMPFYRKWRDFSVIVQKPDTFGDIHRHLQVVDLAPIKRRFCMHLKNDVLIRHDGVVMLNRYDVDGRRSPGNVLRDGLEKVWNKMGKLYVDQWKDNFADAAEICDCDHWWVFNF